MPAFRDVLFLILLVAVFGCSEQPRSQRLESSSRKQAWPMDWSNCLGQSITLEGTAANAKLGAILLGDQREIWIDGLDAWPAGFYIGADQGKRVRVTGTVIERHDLPVFVANKGAPMKSGIPVPEGTDLDQASKRYLLKDAKWTVIE